MIQSEVGCGSFSACKRNQDLRVQASKCYNSTSSNMSNWAFSHFFAYQKCSTVHEVPLNITITTFLRPSLSDLPYSFRTIWNKTFGVWKLPLSESNFRVFYMAVVAISQKLFVMGSVLEKLLAITKSFAKLILKRLQGWFFNVFYQVGQLAFGGSDETSFLIVLNFNPNTTYLPKILIRKAARIFKDGSLARHFLARSNFVLVWLWIRNKAFFSWIFPFWIWTTYQSILFKKFDGLMYHPWNI